MENKRVKKAAKVSKSFKSGELSDDISFELFFSKCVDEGKLKSWQRKEIETFFKHDCSLRDKESLRTYEETLAKF